MSTDTWVTIGVFLAGLAGAVWRFSAHVDKSAAVQGEKLDGLKVSLSEHKADVRVQITDLTRTTNKLAVDVAELKGRTRSNPGRA